MSDSLLDFTNDLEGFEGIRALPAGEYSLRLEFAEIKEGTSSNGNDYKMINVRYSVPDEPEAAAIYHTVWLPVEGQDASQRTRSLDGLKKFLDAHGLDPAFSLEEMVGIEIDAILKEEENNGETQNKVRRFVSGR